MAWRSQGITGSNNIPLGSRRRFGDDDAPSSGHSDGYHKRGRSPERAVVPLDGEKRRKKRNRWGDVGDNKAAGLMGLPTIIKANMTSEQLEAYALHLRIEEITQKLKIGDVVPAEGDRSPSPPPQYDNFGRRTNTREFRYRKKLEDERHKQVEKAMKLIPNYHPPADYRRPTKTQEKVYVPVNDYPEINFIGLLIGPRGNTLKNMETQSGAKIAIRGKGSVKEGKGRSDAAHTSNQEEDLHCLIIADTEAKIDKAKELIHNVIETAASIPEGQNELKRKQLRELAALNGTLRDDENQACANCGQLGHRKWDCPEQKNFTANVVCRLCGNAGHFQRDCPDRQKGQDWRAPPANGAGGPRRIGDAVDREYEQLMQELGGGESGSGGPRQRIEAGPGGQDGHDNHGRGGPAPWQQGPTGAPAPWARRDDPSAGNSGAPAPWASGGNNGYQQNNDYGSSGAAPWQQQQSGGNYQGYGGYGGYNMGAPPGMSGQSNSYAGYGQNYGDSAPPPPPSDNAPPPPPSDRPPPPPPGA